MTDAQSWHQLGFMREVDFVDRPHRLHGAVSDNDAQRHILFLHGVSRNWRTFHTLFPSLHGEFQISALDFRGHGGSEHVPGHYLVTDYVQDALQVLDKIDAKETIIYGHSLGAMVALAVAAQAADHVSAIVLEDPPFSTMGANLPGTPLWEYFRGMSQTVASSRDAEALYESFSSLVVGGKQLRETRDEPSRRFAAEGFTTLDPGVFEPILAGHWLQGYDSSLLLMEVRCPILLLQAESQSGGMLRDDEAAMVDSAVPSCRLAHIEGAPHLIHWAQPQRILDEVREFLNS